MKNYIFKINIKYKVMNAVYMESPMSVKIDRLIIILNPV